MTQHTTNNKCYNYVIIGGGIAGVTCCQQLISIHNEQKTQKSIALISAHPLLKGVSKLQKISQYLMDIEVTEYSSQQFMDKYSSKSNDNYVNLSIIHGYVTNIDDLRHTITYRTRHQESIVISFNKCLIATGGSPKLFHINNVKQKHNLIHALRDSETVQHFSQIMSSSDCNNIMIVGNGGISMELVYALLKHERDNKLNIYWIIKHTHIGNTFLDQASSAFLMPALFPNQDPDINVERLNDLKVYEHILNDPKHGGAVGPRWIANISKHHKQRALWMDYTEIHDDDENKQEQEQDTFANELILKINCDVSCIEEMKENKKLQLKVLLTNGEALIVDQLLCAMGVIPNTSFCDDNIFNKTKTNQLMVNEYLETNISDIYCAGDCCCVQLDDDNMSNAWFQMNLWSQSQTMGWIAAHSMSCRNMHEIENNIHLQFNFELFAHLTRFFGQKCVFLGKYNTKKDDKLGINVLMRVKPTQEFIKVIVEKGRVIGVVLIGDTGLEETFENLILNKTDISCYGDDFLNFNVDLEDMFD